MSEWEILIAILIAVAAAAILAVLIRHFIKKRENKKAIEKSGAEGGKIVSDLLGKLSAENIVLNDIILEKSGRSCQIDHIVVNPRGVFCIETKHCKGIISGKREDREWVQTVEWSDKKRRIGNPIKQNATHIYFLSRIIPKELNVRIQSIIVFVDSDLRYVDEPEVVSLENMPQRLFTGENVLTSEQIDYIAKKIIDSSGEVSKKRHLQNIKKTKKKIKNMICPRCGSALIMEKRSDGKYYKCSNDSCKFSQKK